MRYARDRRVVLVAESGEDWHVEVVQLGNERARVDFTTYEDCGDLSADECERIAAGLLKAAAVLRDGT